ncbi:hypothetical protein N0V87_009060 [Didymella glomerata]|jgi:hypothetical protein|uniref:Uncharacterized protein n=1 Tax=Didymella glomerata TaxID=749621 RepID=A0A9W9BWK2_9PLEO|nr:hypothetical protein N0V87_009060 [Didymella glomerata]
MIFSASCFAPFHSVALICTTSASAWVLVGEQRKHGLMANSNKLFEPEIPGPCILKELDFKCWWGAYDNLLDFYEYELDHEDDEEDTGDSGCNSDEKEDDSTSMASAEDSNGGIGDDEASDDKGDDGDDSQPAAKP